MGTLVSKARCVMEEAELNVVVGAGQIGGPPGCPAAGFPACDGSLDTITWSSRSTIDTS